MSPARRPAWLAPTIASTISRSGRQLSRRGPTTSRRSSPAREAKALPMVRSKVVAVPLLEGWEDVELPDWEYFDRPPWGEEPPWRSRQDYRELPYDLISDGVLAGREVATSSAVA